MLKTLADRYKIPTTSQTWEVELFNKCCNLFDIEKAALDQREQDAKIKREILSDLFDAKQEALRLKLYEGFINHVAENEDDRIFASRLQHKLNKYKEELNKAAQKIIST